MRSDIQEAHAPTTIVSKACGPGLGQTLGMVLLLLSVFAVSLAAFLFLCLLNSI